MCEEVRSSAQSTIEQPEGPQCYCVGKPEEIEDLCVGSKPEPIKPPKKPNKWTRRIITGINTRVNQWPNLPRFWVDQEIGQMLKDAKALGIAINKKAIRRALIRAARRYANSQAKKYPSKPAAGLSELKELNETARYFLGITIKIPN